jgi:hypothetical protein
MRKRKRGKKGAKNTTTHLFANIVEETSHQTRRQVLGIRGK